MCTNHSQAKVAMHKVRDKKWLQHVSCVIRKDEEEEEEREKSIEKRTTYTRKEREKKKASERVTNK